MTLGPSRLACGQRRDGLLPTHDDETYLCAFDGTAGLDNRPARGGVLVTQGSPLPAEKSSITVKTARSPSAVAWDVTLGLGVLRYAYHCVLITHR